MKESEVVKNKGAQASVASETQGKGVVTSYSKDNTVAEGREIYEKGLELYEETSMQGMREVKC